MLGRIVITHDNGGWALNLNFDEETGVLTLDENPETRTVPIPNFTLTVGLGRTAIPAFLFAAIQASKRGKRGTVPALSSTAGTNKGMTVKLPRGLSWDEVRAIMERAVGRGLERRQAGPVPHIAVDEKSFRKRHRYLRRRSLRDGLN